jgi:hypothetical protein
MKKKEIECLRQKEKKSPTKVCETLLFGWIVKRLQTNRYRDAGPREARTHTEAKTIFLVFPPTLLEKEKRKSLPPHDEQKQKKNRTALPKKWGVLPSLSSVKAQKEEEENISPFDGKTV